MKVFLNIATRFWLLFAFGCGVVVSAENPESTHERLAFINFSDKPVEIFWVPTGDPKERRESVNVVKPYDTYIAKTVSGHHFGYFWGESFYTTTVQRDSNMVVKGDDGPEDVDTTKIKAQVHVLGSLDANNPEYQKQLQEGVVLPIPETKKVVCGTTKGDIHISIKPFWSPYGAARFLDLASNYHRYFDGCALNRVMPKFLVQFGIGEDYWKRRFFRQKYIPDDPFLDPPIRYKPGYMSFASTGKDKRSSEVFIVMPDASEQQLNFFGSGESTWETPFGYVDEDDLNIVGSFHSYGEIAPVSFPSYITYECSDFCQRCFTLCISVCWMICFCATASNFCQI